MRVDLTRPPFPELAVGTSETESLSSRIFHRLEQVDPSESGASTRTYLDGFYSSKRGAMARVVPRIDTFETSPNAHGREFELTTIDLSDPPKPPPKHIKLANFVRVNLQKKRAMGRNRLEDRMLKAATGGRDLAPN